ncbi:MAG: hypothetical protein K2N38_11620 [Oscillospiraceae bacterium]|nr:hypothetical protein [Oscillospiraceae bacterium]
MIRRALTEGELNGLPKYGLEAQKIRALLVSYGLKYDFCRFYVGEWSEGSAFLGGLNGSFVLSENGRCDFGELTEFIEFVGISELFCSESAGEQFALPRKKVNVMRFEGVGEQCSVETEPPLGEVYEVLKTAFDIEFEPWYLDMSHRVRHGVTAFRRLDGSVLAVQHNINGEALLSQIATLPEKRGLGNARRLISAVCAELSDSRVYVVCEDALLGFYRSLGFHRTGAACLIFRE